MSKFDVIVIGAGPGGYVAAIRAAQLGLKTACIDQWLGPDGKPALGGTCLNVGCIPSKALLDSSHHFHNLEHLLPAHGIRIEKAEMDVCAMMARKDTVVSQLTRGIAGLLKKNKVQVFAGTGRLVSPTEVTVTGHDDSTETIEGAHLIIATGSVPIDIPVARVDGVHIVDNVGALSFDTVPEHLGVIGAGVIGLELGSVWNRLGSEVVLIEALDAFLPTADTAISRAALKTFKAQGLDIRLGARVTEARAEDDGVSVDYENAEGTHTARFDKLVVAVGRRAHADELNAAGIGCEVDERGRVLVDDRCRTAVANVFAIGDVTPGPMLAHRASEDGVAVAEIIAGQQPRIDHELMPWVIYTHPEIAWVGKTEQELKEAGTSYTSGTFPFMASGRAQGAGETDGMVKMLADKETDRILGVHVFGPSASELLAEAVLAMSFEGSAEDIARTIHAHPTLAEAMHEAALGTAGRTIHI